MAASKVLSLRELHLLSPSICWNLSQRNFSKERTILKKLGFPEKPKRPLNGYVAYVMNVRQSVKEQNPNLSFAESSRLMGKNWRELPQSEKQKYMDEFQNKLKEYKEEIKEYNECLSERQKREVNELITGFRVAQKEKAELKCVKKLEMDLNKPKKPVSPFNVFCTKQEKPKNLKDLVDKWKQMSDSEKEKYRVLFNKEKEEYKKNLEKWEEQMIQEGNVDLIRLKTLKGMVQKLG